MNLTTNNTNTNTNTDVNVIPSTLSPRSELELPNTISDTSDARNEDNRIDVDVQVRDVQGEDVQGDNPPGKFLQVILILY